MIECTYNSQQKNHGQTGRTMATNKHIEILCQGVQVWNRWRREQPKTRPNLSHADLPLAKLKGIDLHNANLSYTNLRDADLREANLEGADVSLIDLRGSRLNRASLRGIRSLHSAFGNCDLRDADLARARLENSGFEGADFRGSSLGRAKLFSVDFNGADLSGLELPGAYLSDSDCRRAKFVGTDLTGAELRGADLSDADLTDACLDATKCDATPIVRYFREDDPEALSADAQGDRPNNTKLQGAVLRGATFRGAILTGLQLHRADCRSLDFAGACLRKADFSGSRMARVILSGCDLRRANLSNCDLERAWLNGADLRGALLTDANMKYATLAGSKVYGVSAWNVCLHEAKQQDLLITADGEPALCVDNLEIAQFIHMLIDNVRIRNAIDSLATKVILILGRFTPTRMRVLEVIRTECRKNGFIPMLFDFAKPRSRNLTESVKTLACLARCIIADITDARSVPQELYATIRELPSVPVQPLLLKGKPSYGMFSDFESYDWVLPVFTYRNSTHIRQMFRSRILSPIDARLITLRTKYSLNHSAFSN